MKKVKDHYYQKAKKEGFVARSVYKLEEIDQKEKLLKAKMKVMDLGCHPGSWTQYASKKVGAEGMVIGIDIQKVYQKFSKNVQIFQEDIYHLKLSNLPLTEFDFIISDIAPKTTGIRTLDAQRSFQLGEQVLSVAKETLNSEPVTQGLGNGQTSPNVIPIPGEPKVVYLPSPQNPAMMAKATKKVDLRTVIDPMGKGVTTS